MMQRKSNAPPNSKLAPGLPAMNLTMGHILPYFPVPHHTTASSPLPVRSPHVLLQGVLVSHSPNPVWKQQIFGASARFTGGASRHGTSGASECAQPPTTTPAWSMNSKRAERTAPQTPPPLQIEQAG